MNEQPTDERRRGAERQEDEREAEHEEQRVDERGASRTRHVVERHPRNERDVARDERQHAGREKAGHARATRQAADGQTTTSSDQRVPRASAFAGISPQISRLSARAATARRAARAGHAADRRARLRRSAPRASSWATARRSRRWSREEGYTLRRWFCGLPSATPYCQAGIFHGENEGIPAFRFYDKAARRVITCNAPPGVQYIRDRIHAPGALAGGSSYVNLLDGDAQTVAFTVATRERCRCTGGSAERAWRC